MTPPILPGIDGVKKMSRINRQLHRCHRPAGGDVRQGDAGAGCESGGVLAAPFSEDPPEAGGPNRAKRELGRRTVARFHGENAAPGPKSTSTGYS